MLEYWKDEEYVVEKSKWIPNAIKDYVNVEHVEALLKDKALCVSFSKESIVEFNGKGSYVVLDYGKELCGGIRIVTCDASGMARFRLTFGESLSECYASIGEKNATNDHSPRDFEVDIVSLSDLTFGQTGFRFVRIELLTEEPVFIRNIFAISTLPVFEREHYIKTSDAELNKIIDTAVYTLKLNFQMKYCRLCREKNYLQH